MVIFRIHCQHEEITMTTQACETSVDIASLSLWNLIHLYEEEHGGWEKKKVAEVTFAIAVALKRTAENMRLGFRDNIQTYLKQARKYACECIEALTDLPNSKLQEVATEHTALARVALPNYFYLTYVTNTKFFPDFCALLEKK